MSIEKLAELSRFYGSNPEYTLAGGGNTSFKDEKTLFVKASGFSLADATADSFVKMDRQALNAIWEKTYPASSNEREKEILADLMAARKDGEKRPSVEALLHDIIPFSYVVHLHPALVNGLCCSKNGETAFKVIFCEDTLWIPSTNPGYILSRLVKTALDEYYAAQKKHPSVILLQNHGIFAGANTIEGIKRV
ncbi:MAG: class II aldolase/adducin family protein [Treponema sp.]|jgi:rhamnose utilization protein RhaD (predicted bifunctional aldolase and dehydrogenase)|nr:class II aldolase/adducin family protein [Treponema sp.]